MLYHAGSSALAVASRCLLGAMPKVSESPELVQLLQDLGLGGKFEDSEVIGFKAKGFVSECVAVLQKRFPRVNAGARGLLICKQCAWTSTSLGLRRATKHMVFRKPLKPKEFLELHQMKEGDAIPDKIAKLCREYSVAGNRTVVLQTIFAHSWLFL